MAAEKKKISERLADFLHEVDAFVLVLERTGVNTATSIGPWLAPVVPTILTSVHLVQKLELHPALAVIVGLVIELLGISTGSTTALFYQHNRRYTDQKNRVPTWVAGSAFVFYLSVVLSVNVLLALPWRADVAQIVASVTTGLLTLLSVPAIVLLSVRRMQAEVIDRNTRKAKQEDGPQVSIAPATAPETDIRVPAQAPQPAPDPEQLQGNRRKVFDILAQAPATSQAEIARQLNITRQAVGDHVKSLSDHGFITKNGGNHNAIG